MRIRSLAGFKAAALLIALSLTQQASAATFIGTIDWIEVWPSGNVAFTLDGVSEPCPIPQFIINKTNDGAKNLIAALFMARASGISLTVTQSTCGAADGYGGQYAIIDYLYIY